MTTATATSTPAGNGPTGDAAPSATNPATTPGAVTTPSATPAGDALSIGDNPAVAKPTDSGATLISYEKTGDAGLDMALGFVGKLGFGPDHAAMVAAMNGDFSLLKAELAGKGTAAAGWEQYLALAEKSHTDGAEKAKAENAKTTAMIHEAVGGEDAWQAIQKWAGENAEPAEKTAVNAALKAGGIQAKAMAMWLSSTYQNAAGVTIEPAAVIKPGARANTAADAGSALTAQSYAMEVQKLRQSMGYAFEQSQEYRNLQNRRVAGQRRGI